MHWFTSFSNWHFFHFSSLARYFLYKRCISLSTAFIPTTIIRFTYLPLWSQTPIFSSNSAVLKFFATRQCWWERQTETGLSHITNMLHNIQTCSFYILIVELKLLWYQISFEKCFFSSSFYLWRTESEM